MATQDDRRALVDLFPQFLMRVLRSWNGMMPVLESAGLDRLASFLLRALVEERDAGEGMTDAEMRADLFNPYSTIRPIVDALPTLVAKGYVARDGDRYTVTDAGRVVVARVKAARDLYLASLTPIPSADLTRLAGRLTEIALQLRDAPEPMNKAHQARAWRAMPSADAAPMVRLYGAVYALWMARDDSHNAAWRAAGFDGPAFDVLSRVWSGEATTIPALTEAVQQFQRPEDVAKGIERLIAAGYLTREGDALELTPHGTETRERIEAETDRRYFAPWPPLKHADLAQLRTTLAAVIAGLPA
jgi:hypothetical protein